MSSNAELTSALERMAKLMELLGEDSFRVAAHARAARAVEGSAQDLVALGKREGARAELTKLEGIGPKMADKIVQFATEGKLAELDELSARVPPGLLSLLHLQGIGPKTVRLWWTEAGVTDLASLQKIIDDGSILKLPRMGAKAVEKLKGAIAVAQEMGGAGGAAPRLALGRAWAVAQRVIEHLRVLPGVQKIEAAGSLRRGRDTVGDLDILVAAADAGPVAAAFREMPGVVQVLLAGDGRSSVRMTVGAGSRWDEGEGSGAAAEATVQVDLRVLPLERFGAALAYFTGSKEHNVRLRQRALDMGLTLSDWGLFVHEKDAKEPPHVRGLKPIAAATEEEVHRALGLAYMPPEIREDRGETELKETPRLVEVADIRAELHAHTTASDGVLSIVELAREAQRRGFHTIAVTDHSQSSALAGGLKPAALRAHIAAIREARALVPGIAILAGSEVDILADGRLDYDDELLAELDVVVASPHAALTQDSARATERLIAAVRHPLVHILGHPTGRLVLKRRGLEPDMGAVIEAARAHNVALEINSHWMRLDLRDVHVRAAIDAGCVVAIDCDVHHPSDFDNLRFGVMTARRGWTTPARCINTWSASELHGWLRKKR
jgi:DNA polymerase (family 10)